MQTAAPLARLLIVDDEAGQLKALCATLNHEGYQTVGLTSPRGALETLRQEAFDVLLTDLKMPDMDGLELIRAAKTIDPELAALVMTGHGSIDTAVRALQQGAFDYILKPFKLNALLAVLARVLEIRRLRHEHADLLARERRQALELSAAYRDLESFSYSISHDLRAPLRAIDGFARALEEDFGETLGEAGLKHIEFIRRGCLNMQNLVAGLLEFSRACRSELRLEPIDMHSLVVQVSAEVRAGYEVPVPTINIEQLPQVNGDATVLRQVWANLIDNALKYSAKKQNPTVHVSGETGEGEARFHVRDNGAGFDMRFADRLFGVFQRLHAGGEFAGTGVGLAIVQRIVARHGGRIWAEAEPDRGAVFHFTLPLPPSSPPT